MSGALARTGWRALLTLLVLGTCWLAFSPAPPPQIDTGWDKLNHWIAFSSMAFSACFAFPQTRARYRKVALALLAFGIFIELVQLEIPNRSAEVLDVVADAIGIMGGLLPAWWWQRRRRAA